MENIINLLPTFWEFLGICMIFIINWVLSYYLANNPTSIFNRLTMFNMKPFVCDKCLGWWLNIIVGIIMSYITLKWFLYGIILATITFIIRHLDSKQWK